MTKKNRFLFFLAAYEGQICKPSNGWFEFDILNADGKYKKTACFTKEQKSYNDALAHCNNIGTRLFVIDSLSTQKSLLRVASENFPWNFAFAFDGKRNKTDGKWYFSGSPPYQLDKFWNISNIEWDNHVLIYNENESTSYTIQSFGGGPRSFVCEFVKKSPCISPQRDIFDSNGKYIKTACFVHGKNNPYAPGNNLIDKGPKNHPSGYRYCESAGMKIFVIESVDVLKSLLASLKDVKNFPVTSFHVDGKRNVTDGKWYFVGSGKPIPIFEGLNLPLNSTATRSCLKVYNQNGTEFKVRALPCDTWSNPICEFVK
jgi:hypothetical protein